MKTIQQCYSDDILDRANFPAAEKWEKESPLQYHNLPYDRRVLIDRLLRGMITDETLPPKRSRIVRIYIASTATGKLYYTQEGNSSVRK